MVFMTLAADCLISGITWLYVFSVRVMSDCPSDSEQPPVSEHMDVSAFEGCLRRQIRQLALHAALL